MLSPARALLHAALLLSASGSLCAQTPLYTWRDPQGSRSITIKSFPPPWYDDSGWTRGPRVQVLRNKAVVDDTNWNAEKRQDARNKATAEEIKRLQAERAAAPAKKPAKPRKDEDDEE